MRAHRLCSMVLFVLVAMLACALVLAGSAFAKPGYIPAGSFSPPEGFGQPFGVAVDNSGGLSKGDVYVSDRGSDMVDEFSSAGVLLAQAGVSGVTLGQLSVAEAGAFAGDVYVAGESNGVVYRFAPGLGSREELVTGLESPSAVAVDGAGDVFVTEKSAGEVLEFDSAGQPVNPSGTVVGAGENAVVGGLTGRGVGLQSLAVAPSGSNLYITSTAGYEGSTFKNSEIFEYVLTAGSYVATNPGFTPGGFMGGVALAASGDVYVDYQLNGPQAVVVYAPSGALVTVGSGPLSYFSSGLGFSIASNDVYVADSSGQVFVFEGGERPETPVTEPDSGLNGSLVTLNGKLMGGESSYYFEYKIGSSCEGGSRTAEVSASGVQQVHVEVSELAKFSKYSFCLVTRDKYGIEVGPVLSFETGQVQPRISGESVSSVATHTSTVLGQINPEGVAATYDFEYGRSLSYGSKTPQFSVGAGEAVVPVSAPLTGLEPGATYHFRLVATNAVGVIQGPDVTFATYSAALAGLPDGRVYEMVSPAYNPYDMEVYETNAGLLSTHVPFEASAKGNAVVYAGTPSAEGTGSSGTGAGDQYRAMRSPQGGWKQDNITPVGGAAFEKYAGFSSDLSAGVIPSGAVAPFVTTTALNNSTSRTYEELYETSFGENIFRPLFAIVPPNREFSTGAAEYGDRFSSEYAGASADFTHFLFEANDMLVENKGGRLEEELALQTKKASEVGKEIVKLEEENVKYTEEGNEAGRQRVDGEISALAPLADHQELYVSTEGRTSLVNVLPDGGLADGATFGAQGNIKNVSNAISADGSRIFWSGINTTPNVVYVRIDGSKTVQVSAGPGTYRTASPDGRYAYYTEHEDLWRYDVEHETREEIAGPQAKMSGVIGVNQTGEDGAYVYFVAAKALTSEENAEKQRPLEGEDNLYVSEPDPARPGQHITKFIATLSFEDEADWALAPSLRTAEVAPDGHSVVFASTSNLTGHSYPGEGTEEVYDYRADEGRLFCASCTPQASGGRLHPPGEPIVFTRRWVSENGDRVFFESEAPLALQDVNGVTDVYEWEPDGTGSCAATEGCVYLLSGGLESTAFFADASASGDDVFMVTRQRLLPEDENDLTDLYDARVNGAQPVAPPQCTGTGCQGAPASAPIFATPSSVTFNGVGDFSPPQSAGKPRAKGVTREGKLQHALEACRRKRAKRKQRTRCEASAHKLYGVKRSARRSTRKGAK